MCTPIPHYEKGDLTAAMSRLAEIDKARDRLGRFCKPFPEWVPLRPLRTWHAAAAIETLHGCRYPIGEPSDPGFHFCNEPRKWSSQYCEEHAALCERRYLGWGY